MFFMWLPMYCVYLYFNVWMIWAFVMLSFFQKWLDSFWLIWVFDSHLSTYWNSALDVTIFWFLCSFIMNA